MSVKIFRDNTVFVNEVFANGRGHISVSLSKFTRKLYVNNRESGPPGAW